MSFNQVDSESDVSDEEIDCHASYEKYGYHLFLQSSCGHCTKLKGMPANKGHFTALEPASEFKQAKEQCVFVAAIGSGSPVYIHLDAAPGDYPPKFSHSGIPSLFKFEQDRGFPKQIAYAWNKYPIDVVASTDITQIHERFEPEVS